MSLAAGLASLRPPQEGAPFQPRVAGVAALALAALALLTLLEAGLRQALLVVIGAFAGVALYHGAFGFTAAWRRLILEGRSVGVRAQLVMLLAASLVFFPLLSLGQSFAGPVSGFVFPIGAALVLGAFLFGLGMQLGGGCGSGTLFTVGGGSVRMLVTLAFFIIGSVIATAGAGWWLAWPALPGVSAVESLGAGPGLALMAALLGLAYLMLVRREKALFGSVAPLLPTTGRIDLLRGPWPLLIAALALALVNVLTLLVAGQPWGITSAFALWGSKMLAGFGVPVAEWSYWRGDPALEQSLLKDVTSVMDFGLIVGALLAAAMAGKFAPNPRIPARSLAAAVLGGLLMGIGARLGTGCNIGAFFSGGASGSLHALVWLAVAVAGNVAGVRLRPWFKLD